MLSCLSKAFIVVTTRFLGNPDRRFVVSTLKLYAVINGKESSGNAMKFSQLSFEIFLLSETYMNSSMVSTFIYALSYRLIERVLISITASITAGLQIKFCHILLTYLN